MKTWPLDFNRVTGDSGDISMKRILSEVVSAPGSIPALIRFGQRSRLAAESLAIFWIVFCKRSSNHILPR